MLDVSSSFTDQPAWSMFRQHRWLRVLRRILGNDVVVSFVAAILAILATSISAHAETWVVVLDTSKIEFSGTHAGAAFKGEFKTWRADIVFDPTDLASAKADVRVDLTSATTGDMTYDKTLPTGDWFNTSALSEGRFVSTAFRAKSDTAFEADGTLDIRGFKVPVTLDFTFKRDGDTATLTGKTTLKRLDFGIGKGSDATGAWVSLDIPLTFDVSLQRAGDGAGPKS